MWNGVDAHASAMRAARAALPRILDIQPFPGLALDLDAMHREVELRRRESRPCRPALRRSASVRSISTSCCGIACHSADNDCSGVRASLLHLLEELRRAPATAAAARPRGPRRSRAPPASACRRACPPSMRGSSAHAVPHIEVARARRRAATAICSPATSYSLRLTIVHSAWPAPGKRLANTPACSVFSYGVQSALTMSGANCRWIVAIRRSVSASRGVS